MIERNKYGRAIVRAEVDGFKGTAEICRIENDGFNVPHWGIFITVPFQDSKWEKFFGEHTEEELIGYAKEHLEYRLSRCTLCC